MSFPMITRPTAAIALISLMLPLALLAGAGTLRAAEKAAGAAGVRITRDLAFLAEGRKEKLDLYEPERREEGVRAPAVVIIHGGGWVGGDKGARREILTGSTLARAGYVCVSIDYSMREGRRWPLNLHDCKNAVRWLRVKADELGIDVDNIGVIGGSAGGHLALMVAYTAGDPRLSPGEPYPGVRDDVKAVVNMYGITNLLTRCETEADGTPNGKPKHNTLFAQSREEDPELWRFASPVSHIGAKTPPTLTFHGTADTVVDRDQAKELHRALQAGGVESTLRMIEGATHAWPLKTKDFDLTGEMVAFFDRHLRP